jgi:hypothetical protein
VFSSWMEKRTRRTPPDQRPSTTFDHSSRRFRQTHLSPEGVLLACRHCHDLTYESVQTRNQRWSELMRASSDQCGEPDWDAVRRLAGRRPMCFFNMMAYRERRGG